MGEKIQIDFPLGYANIVSACENNHGIEAARKFVTHDVDLLTDAFIRYAREASQGGKDE